MDSMLSNLHKYYPFLPPNIIKRIYRARLERLRVLMRNDFPEDIRWLIEAQVRLSGKFSNSFKYMPGTGKSSFAKKRRAKRLGGCYKCARWTCDTRCKSVGFVSINREDKMAFIKDGLSKESMDHDIHQILDTHPSGYVHRELIVMWIQFKDERKCYSHEKLVSKDPVCGYGTLNEIFNITSWAERDFHTKLTGLLNINNFFSDLLAFLDKGVDHKFISHPSRDILICADTVADLLIKFQTYILVKNLEVKDHQPQAIDAKRKRSLDPLDLSL
ncbi:hypothetical protein OROGR_015950 [Orobanche gracilis]